MTSYSQVFKSLKAKNQGALAAFAVIGDPDFKTSLQIVKKIIDAGADILELGLPFSDPIADGPSIQSAGIRALDSGMNTDIAFDFIREIRKYTDAPIGILSYYNLIYRRGMGRFYSDSKKAGVDSILIADVPIEEYDEISENAKKNNIDAVLMISPLTGDNRIKKISASASGFIYAVSRLGVTGARASLESSALELIKRIRKFTAKPICVGFGVSRPEHVKNIIKAGADGAIVGSAIADLIAKNIKNKKLINKGKMLEEIRNYVRSMKEAARG